MLRSLFHHADQLLTQYRPYWQMQPFHFRHLNECSQLPENLLTELEKLDSDQFELLNTNSEAGKQWLAKWISCLNELEQIQNNIPDVDNSETFSEKGEVCIKHLSTGIPGRKWSQIEQFSHFLPIVENSSKQKLLEWCAGKGHLGRLLSISKGYQVTSLEWQQTLCDQGEAVVGQQKKRYPQLQQSLLQGDALSDEAAKLLSHHQTAVALHACGDLHTRLITQCCKPDQAIEQLAIAPCCYHLTEADSYQPFSISGQKSSLILSRQDLKIPLQETVTGGQRISRLRDIELHWRLSFDLLRQTLTGETLYKPLPAFPKKLLSGEFKDFVHWALVNRKLQSEDTSSDDLPFSDAELSQALLDGKARLLRVRKLEWLQSHFRRVLEIWLVADRALALEEAGFHVELHQFCDKSISPRNLLILAKR